MRSRTIVLVAAIGVIAASVTPASAYRLIGASATDGTYCAGTPLQCSAAGPFTRWFRPVVPFWVNQDAATDATGSALTQAEIVTAAQDAYQLWEDVPDSFLKFTYQGQTTARLAADDRNTLLFYNAAFDSGSCAGALGSPSGTLAITVLTEDLPTGEITDADVIYDSADAWDVNTNCVNFDFLSTLAHEYGHSVGIHHTEIVAPIATRPTMDAYYFCDAGVASQRTLEADDRSALQCLYPENPAVILMDETGSMSVGDRMNDAKAAANLFVDDFADNTMAVASFAQGSCPDGLRDGYNLRQDWTALVAPLHTAINATFACGITPMWESICCGIGKATSMDPANLLVITDTEENASGGACSAECPAGYCGCIDVNDALVTAGGTDVSVYVIDVTQYSGLLAAGTRQEHGTCSETGAPCQSDEDCRPGETCIFPPDCNQQFPTPEGQELKSLADDTGGLYCSAFTPDELELARLAIEKHMMDKGKAKQNPPTCFADPGRRLADDIQRYDAMGQPISPYLGQQVEVRGLVSVRVGSFDPLLTYVQDCSGGIQLRGTSVPPLEIGRDVIVRGTVGTNGLELSITPTSVEQVGAKELEPPPVVGPLDGRDFEAIGSLLTVRGYAETAPGTNRTFQLVSDLQAPAPPRITVFLHVNTGIDPGTIKQGHAYEITGIVAHPNRDNQLMPRFGSDIVEVLGANPSLPGEGRGLRASWNKTTRQIDITYQPACGAANHTVYLGPLSQVSSYNYTEARCALGTSGSASFDPGAVASIFFLIVGENGVDEGSYGRNGAGLERPEDVATPVCDRPRALGATCD